MAGNITHTIPLFDFEKNFDAVGGMKWLENNYSFSFWCAAVYVVVIHSLRWYMKDKEPFNLRTPLSIWSSILALFSIAATIRTAPELYYALKNKPFEYSVCSADFILESPSALWVYIWTHAKVYELGDTIFIVLRKQPLIFLHWYHHITAMTYSYYSLGRYFGPTRYITVMNTTIHSVMYMYYALRAMRFKVPRTVNIMITLMQLSQMVWGVFLSIMVIVYQRRGHECSGTPDVFYFTFLLYGSYTLLFAHFFYTSYIKPKPKPVEKLKCS